MSKENDKKQVLRNKTNFLRKIEVHLKWLALFQTLQLQKTLLHARNCNLDSAGLKNLGQVQFLMLSLQHESFLVRWQLKQISNETMKMIDPFGKLFSIFERLVQNLCLGISLLKSSIFLQLNQYGNLKTIFFWRKLEFSFDFWKKKQTISINS